MNSLTRYFADVSRIRAVGRSTNQWVEVVRHHDGDLDVHIRPGLLHRCTEEEVAAEVRTALIAAIADHRRQYRQLRIDYFGSSLGVEEFTPPQPSDDQEQTR